MAIGFKNTGTGGDIDIIPHIKYNAKAGRAYRVDRIESGGQWVTDETEITGVFSAVFDLEEFEVGWLYFPQAGGAPDFRFVPFGEDPGPRPTENHKEGFRIMLMLSKEASEGYPSVREFVSSAGAVKNALSDLHTAYEDGLVANPGKLPVVRIKGNIKRDSKHGTNYEPQFEITGWVERPAKLVFVPKGMSEAKTGGNGASARSPAASGPAATGATLASPPKAAASADRPWEDFG